MDDYKLLVQLIEDMQMISMHPVHNAAVREAVEKILRHLGRDDLADYWIQL